MSVPIITITTYESGGGGGLSLISSSLSMSNIVWRTVAELDGAEGTMNLL
jgi:hypothetical protein